VGSLHFAWRDGRHPVNNLLQWEAHTVQWCRRARSQQPANLPASLALLEMQVLGVVEAPHQAAQAPVAKEQIGLFGRE
jgi:hypothetical protein